jgi:hypothetical protein
MHSLAEDKKGALEIMCSKCVIFEARGMKACPGKLQKRMKAHAFREKRVLSPNKARDNPCF